MFTNIKTIMITDEGRLSRMAITYDVYNDEGEIMQVNRRASRIITDKKIMEHVDVLLEYAEGIIKEK